MEVEIVDLNPESATNDYSIYSKPESATKDNERVSRRKSSTKTKRKRSESCENKILNYTNIQSQNSITSKEKYSKEWRRHSYGVVRRSHISDSFKDNLRSLKDRRKTLERGVEILSLRDGALEETCSEVQSMKRNRCSDITESEQEKSIDTSCTQSPNKETVVREERKSEVPDENWVCSDTEKIELFNENKSFSTEGDTSLKQTPDNKKPEEESFEDESPRVQCFQIPSGVIVCQQHPSQFALIGLAKLTILSGQLRIMEYLLKNDRQTYDIFSSNVSCYLELKTLYGGTSKRKKLKKRLSELEVSKDDQHAVFKCHEKNNVIYLLENSDFNIPPFRKTIFTIGVSSFYAYEEPSMDLIQCNEILQSVRVSLEHSEKVSTAYLTMEQKCIVEEINSNLYSSAKPPIVMVCGPKNSGKSTFNRLIVNNILNDLQEVCYLDCDIGQPEFTPSGCVSLSIVDKPVLGPPFSHARRPKKCYFYGTLSPTDDPDAYIKCLKKVVSYYMQHYTHLPLIINTMGFVTGLGLHLLKETVKLLHPTIIVQIDGRKTSMNFRDDLYKILEKEKGWESFKTWRKEPDEAKTFEAYHPVMKHIFAVVNRDHTSFATAVDHRDLMFSSYMCSGLKHDTSLLSQKPKSVPWNQIALHALPHKVPEYQMLLVMNGCAVGLCHTDLSKASRPNENSPWFLQGTPQFECYGFGIVRGIDKEKQCIYVITPLSLKELESVNTLVKGDLRIPQILMFKEGQDCDVPYVDTQSGHDAVGGDALKRKRLSRAGK